MGERALDERRLDRLARPVRDVQHAPRRVSALARQVEVRAVPVQRKAVLQQPPDRVGTALDHELHDLGVAEAGAGLDRVAHVARNGVPGVHDGGDAALRAVRRSALDAVLGQHQDACPVGDAERRCEAGRPRPHDQDVGGVLPFHVAR